MRKIRVRKHHDCYICHKPIAKGDMAHVIKLYFPDEGYSFHTLTLYTHIRCQYYQDKSIERFKKFDCHHPDKMVEEIWTYIPGEAVKEPSHCVCHICGKRI